MVDGSVNSSTSPRIKRTDGRNLRRYSMGKLSSFDVDEQSIPHHRRSSLGSCHDFCKYGNKHSFETKARDPVPKKGMKKSLDGRNLALPKREKSTVLMAELNASPDFESSIADNTNMVKLEVPINSHSRQSPVEIEAVNEGKKLTNSGDGRFPRKLGGFLKPKTSKVNAAISPDSYENTTVQGNKNSKTGKGTMTSKGITAKVSVNSAVSLNLKSVDNVTNISAMKNKSMKVVPPLKSQNRTRTPRTNKARNAEVQEKTLYIINMETKSKLIESDQNVMNASGPCPKPPSSGADRRSLLTATEHQKQFEKATRKEADASVSKSKEEASKGNKKCRSLRKLQSKEKSSSSSSNLNFRKGKVVDIQSEIRSPRRLKFRRGSLLGINQKSNDGQRKSLKKVVPNEISKNSTPPCEKVVLRHQDVEGKESQVLLNNVIEETASKLVRSRKSKVMALVGAFETVISLQHSKPSFKTAA